MREGLGPAPPTADCRRVVERNPFLFNPLRFRHQGESVMGKGCILWMVGVPIPVIIVLYLLFGH